MLGSVGRPRGVSEPELSGAGTRAPAAAKGGRKPDSPADVPESFRHWKRPEWKMPTDLPKWESVDRATTRATLVRLMGEMPPRPDPGKVGVSREGRHDGYTLERFRVPQRRRHGRARHPADSEGPQGAGPGDHRPARPRRLQGERLHRSQRHGQYVGPMLAERGYVVAAIDAYFNGERVGKGPAGRLDKSARAAGDEPVQARPLAGPHALGHDAPRRAVPARLPRDPPRGGQGRIGGDRHEHGLHARLVAGRHRRSGQGGRRRGLLHPLHRADRATATCASTASTTSCPAC